VLCGITPASMKISKGQKKEHLDAYLASAADVIIDQQRDEPG
jgi:hypothetical protein